MSPVGRRGTPEPCPPLGAPSFVTEHRHRSVGEALQSLRERSAAPIGVPSSCRPYREAVERGDPLAESWEKVVPIGCARGQHSWRRRDYWGVLRFRHCDTERAAP